VRKLIMGIVDFRERMLPQYERRFEALALSQAPDALFVTCSDSRVVPDLLASTEPGDLFTMRNVGNLIPPATAEGLSIGDLSEASAIEYAVLVLKVAEHRRVRAFRMRRDESGVGERQKPRSTQPCEMAAPRGWRGVSSGTRGPARCDAETVRPTFSTQRACAA
jgi:Carbonic anhydrase